MPPDRGRASKACAACRKQKTRCYERAAGQACLRCDQLGQECSLTTETRPAAWFSSNSANAAQQDRERIDRLEKLVATLTKRLDDVESILPRQNKPTDDRDSPQDSGSLQIDRDTESAPLFVLRDAATQSGFRATGDTPADAATRDLSDGVILQGLLSEQEAISLLEIFRENYGQWIAFDSNIPITRLLEDVRKSPLLLAACCLIAVRNTSITQASRLAPKLFGHVKTMLSQAMLIVPQPVEFFQASLILSLWSTTIGQIPLGIDGWLLSGFALQHSMASNLFASSVQGRQKDMNKNELDRLCIWNHLCLVHLHYCVGTHRKAVLSQDDVNRCRLILGSDHATNFESRMVAEVNLYWVMYQHCSTSVDLSKTQPTLDTWKSDWEFLLDQPSSQFLQMGFSFAQLLLHDRALKTRQTATAVPITLLTQMIHLSTSIMTLAIQSSDHRTPYLTDHIFHMISFAAVTLCRLLHTYEAQLSSSPSHEHITQREQINIQNLDHEIVSTVMWLHALGIPCHVAHTMGDVVLAIHRRLRPQFENAMSNEMASGLDPGIQEDFAVLFPEFYGLEMDQSFGGSGW
ncbi:hypothetical protein DM02DRAFT_594183 [Periconia macrospinosa]|uniref:Transcriptional activator of proteases prtT n=1 Tax=Periconia macrospinosa TaxID=97972 RepID=A0A2V1DQ57_9PLEO|nr:hypothetical protein DM02DRAFT_594183 [Periconia macrospinosa]